MPRCKNNSNKYYTGKEKSPRGKGFDAEKVPEGTRKKGTNNKLYESKNNVWRLTGSSSVRSPKRNKKTARGWSDDDPKNSIAAFGGGYAQPSGNSIAAFGGGYAQTPEENYRSGMYGDFYSDDLPSSGAPKYHVKSDTQLFSQTDGSPEKINRLTSFINKSDAKQYADEMNLGLDQPNAKVVKLNAKDIDSYNLHKDIGGAYYHPFSEHASRF